MKEGILVTHLYPKITQLSLNRFGISETFLEQHNNPLLYVFCDAIYLTDPTKNNQIAHEFEKLVKQHIFRHWNELSEKTLKKAVEHAQNHFFKNYTSEESQLKVSLTIIIQDPESIDSDTPKILIAGIGDIKVYHLDSSIQLIYYDPEIPQLPENLSLKKRFHYITNAIGVPDTKCNVSSASIKPNSLLLVASYGSYHQTNKEKLFSLFSDFEQKKNQIFKLISRTKEKDHANFFSYFNFQGKQKGLGSVDLNTSQQENIQTTPNLKKKEKSFPSWILKIASVAIVSLLCLEFFNYYINVSQPSSSHSFLMNRSAKPIQTSTNLKTLKKPLEFPFLKERAYIVDLKKKFDCQSEVINKLQTIINDQEDALRDMQVKSFYKHETISAKSYRPDSGSTNPQPIQENFSSKE